MPRDVVLRNVAYRVLAATSDRQPDPDRCQGQSLSGHSHSHLSGHTLRLERSSNQRSETDMARVSGNDLTIGPIRPISGAPRPPTDSTDAMGKQLPRKPLAHPSACPARQRELARFEPAWSETLAGRFCRPVPSTARPRVRGRLYNYAGWQIPNARRICVILEKFIVGCWRRTRTSEVTREAD